MTGEAFFPATANGHPVPSPAHLAQLAASNRFRVELTKPTGR